MRVDAFDFKLPADRIAERPVSPRDAARLLMVGNTTLEDRFVHDLPEILTWGDLLVFNDTRVIPAQLFGIRGAARIGLTLYEQIDETRWWAFAKPARKLKAGDEITIAEGFAARVLQKGKGGSVAIGLVDRSGDSTAALERHGTMPLPPYIAKRREPDKQDRVDYQTVLAARRGAVAAPTAGLHFTRELLERLEHEGIHYTTITLHVGAGTFLPVKVRDTENHVMHPEWGRIDRAAVEQITRAQDEGRRIIAVGSTSLRLLETAADASGRVHPFAGETQLFVTPGYRFRVVDLLLTNFHLPRSTLYMLVCAFSGLARMQGAYAHAIANGYRFYTYGDCCLLEREDRLES